MFEMEPTAAALQEADGDICSSTREVWAPPGVDHGPMGIEEMFPAGCTVHVNDGQGRRMVSTAGASSLSTCQSHFTVLGCGYGRLRGHLRVALDQNPFGLRFGFIEASEVVERDGAADSAEQSGRSPNTERTHAG